MFLYPRKYPSGLVLIQTITDCAGHNYRKLHSPSHRVTGGSLSSERERWLEKIWPKWGHKLGTWELERKRDSAAMQGREGLEGMASGMDETEEIAKWYFLTPWWDCRSKNMKRVLLFYKEYKGCSITKESNSKLYMYIYIYIA